MKKTFQVGQKVTLLPTADVYGDDHLLGQVATVTSISGYYSRHLEYYLTFEGSSKQYFLQFYADEIQEFVPSSLTQVIVNTKGLARTMTQKRDALGRFVKGAQVGLLLAPGHVMGKDKDAVVVHYGYTMFAQTVTSINPVTGRMNCKTFTNDGISKFSEHTVQVQPK